jgi:hypothetical protein
MTNDKKIRDYFFHFKHVYQCVTSINGVNISQEYLHENTICSCWTYYNVINIPGHLGEKYVLFLTDNHSGLHFGFPIASRSGNSIFDCLQNALLYIEQQSGNTLKAIHMIMHRSSSKRFLQKN